jgi:membrane protein YdbS with pleckstrin-like domain
MPKDWYIRQNGKIFGPVPSEKLKLLAAKGKINTSDDVANSQEGPWHSVGRIKGLQFGSSPLTTKPSVHSKPQRAISEATPPSSNHFDDTSPPQHYPVQTVAPHSQASSTRESDIWAGSPSQITNLKTFIVCGIFCWLLIPLFVALWRYLLVKTTRYELTSQRFRSSYGVISKRLDELELYRVKDTAFSQSLFQRIFSLATVSMTSSDSNTPYAAIESIPAGKARELRETIRTLVEELRDRKRVREIDYA